MTAPLVTSTVARGVGFAPALGAVVVLGVALSVWLKTAIRGLSSATASIVVDG